MPEKFGHGKASRIITIIDQRIDRKTRSEAMVETTWGQVSGVFAGDYVSAYLYGESDYQSDYFRLVNGVIPEIGDSIKVAIDKKRGDRWVVEIAPNPSFLGRFDPIRGTLELSADGLLIDGIIAGGPDVEYFWRPILDTDGTVLMGGAGGEAIMGWGPR